MGIKVSKAIEILSTHPILLKTEPDHDYFEAVQLGIEALRFYQGCGDLTLFEIINLLPGETPEEDKEHE